MSFEALLWALKDAPTRDVNEYAVLSVYAELAWPDGCDAHPSFATVVRRTHLDEQTVRRALRRLVARRLMARGDQRAVGHIPKNYRPVNYDLLIPAAWFPNLPRVNAERSARGRPPLTTASRPPIAEAPPKNRRKDVKHRRDDQAPIWDFGGVSEAPLEHSQGYLQDTPEVTERHPGRVLKTPPRHLVDTPEVSTRPARGVSETPNPVHDPVQPEKPSPPPSVPTVAVPRARTRDEEEGETPSADGMRRAYALLESLRNVPIGREASGADDVAARIARRLERGWSEAEIREKLEEQRQPPQMTSPVGLVRAWVKRIPLRKHQAPPQVRYGQAEWTVPELRDRGALGEPAQRIDIAAAGGWRQRVEQLQEDSAHGH